jgi:ABC-type branched-subunit amino acid transport system substrate-binding protein
MNRHLTGIGRQRAIATAAGVTLVLGLAACGGGGGDNGPGPKSLHLLIGNALPLSGTSKALGESGQKASQLAVDRIDQAIGEAGADHTIRLVNEDQGADSASAVQAARKLVEEQGVSCLTGPWSPDAIMRTANDVAIPAKTLEISPVSVGDDVADLSDHDLIDSTALPDSLEGSALMTAIGRDLGGEEGKTVNVAASDDTYGDTITKDFIEAWQDQNGTVGKQIVLAPSALSSSEASLITSGSPDAALLIDGLNGFSQLAPALSSSDSWDPASAWGSDQLVTPGLPELVGLDAVDGMRALAPGTPQDDEASSAFVQAFRSADPQDVELAPFAAQEFDATVLCYLAAVAAGSTDGQQMADELVDITAPGGDEFTWEQLPGAIKALEEGKDIDYAGASGPIDMDVNGNPTDGVFDVYQFSSSGLEVVGEVSVSKPNPAAP